MKTTITIVVMSLMTAATAFAQETGIKGRWSVIFSVGADVPGGGEFHEGGTGVVLGLPTTVASKSSGDVFDTGVAWRAGVGYGVSSNMEVFGEFAWARASASALSVGNVATLDLQAAFDDYTAYGVNGGIRYHFSPGVRVNPYVAGHLGVHHVDAIAGTFSVPAAGVTLAGTPFYDDSMVPMFGADAGVLFAVAPRVSVGVEGGVRYHTGLSELEGLAGTALENLNDAGNRWSIPISGVIRFGF